MDHILNQKKSFFNNFLNFYGLLNLGFVGLPFTWTNERMGVKLLGVVFQFPDITVFYLPMLRPNHCSLLMKTHNSIVRDLKPFRFETMWLNHLDLKNIINKHWNQ